MFFKDKTDFICDSAGNDRRDNVTLIINIMLNYYLYIFVNLHEFLQNNYTDEFVYKLTWMCGEVIQYTLYVRMYAGSVGYIFGDVVVSVDGEVEALANYTQGTVLKHRIINWLYKNSHTNPPR